MRLGREKSESKGESESGRGVGTEWGRSEGRGEGGGRLMVEEERGEERAMTSFKVEP